MNPAFCPCFARNLAALPANTLPPLPAAPYGVRAGGGIAGLLVEKIIRQMRGPPPRRRRAGRAIVTRKAFRPPLWCVSCTGGQQETEEIAALN